MSTFKKIGKSKRGPTLIETLLALVALSLGLLGIAALQMTSMRNNRGAHQRAQAASLAYDIADRMRANRDAAIAGNYTVALNQVVLGGALNELDIQNWKDSLAITLPGGDGSISAPAAGTNVVTITVRWTDTLEGETASAGVQTFTTRTQI